MQYIVYKQAFVCFHLKCVKKIYYLELVQCNAKKNLELTSWDRITLKFPNHKEGNRQSFKVAFSTPIRYFFLLKRDAKGTEFSLLLLFFFSQYMVIYTLFNPVHSNTKDPFES